MNTNDQTKETVKKSWVKPVLIELQTGAENIEAGFDPGSDGDGGVTTSMS